LAIARDDRPPYALTLRTDSGESIQVRKDARGQLTRSGGGAASSPAPRGAAAPASVPLMLTCDECNCKFKPTDTLYTTFGTAHEDQNIDYCAPCVEGGKAAESLGVPAESLVMMTAAARAETQNGQKPRNPPRGVRRRPPESLGGNSII
jgi:hypothetical protein